MAREIDKLSAVKVKKETKPGRYNDGGGLYLLIQKNGNRSWVFRWRDRVTGKLRDKGLGPVWDVSLEKARQEAQRCRELVRHRADPIAEDRAVIEAQRLERAKRLTFGECAEKFVEAHRAGWRNAKHAEQWSSTLKTYAETIYNLPVSEIDTALVLRCLEPIWADKTETATRVRQRIENVLDWAAVRGYRAIGDNPARWRGHLDKLLAKPSKLKKVEHHPALPYCDLPLFMTKLRARQGVTARALEFQILTAARPGEAIAACWSEIDLEKRVWTIPAERMKANREHRVPLSDAAIDLLRASPKHRGFVFPGLKKATSLSIAAPLQMVKEIHPGIVPHGFRSTFRDWAAERTNYPREVAEAALAHALKNKTEAAYWRSDLFEKRRRLMTAWAKFCETHIESGSVTPLRAEHARHGN